MKNNCTLLFLILPFLIGAQDYAPFNLVDNNIWNESSFEGFPDENGTVGAGGGETIGYSYSLLGDSTVNDQQYVKVYSRRNWRYHRQLVNENQETVEVITANNYSEQAVLIGGLRQDTATKTVHFINWIGQDWFNERCFNFNPPLETEVLLYDFGLAIDETVQIGNRSFTLTHIQTKTLLDGTQRRRFQFQESDFQWVDGIGSEIGLFGPWTSPPFESGCGLLCYSEAATTLMEGVSLGNPGILDDSCEYLLLSAKELWSGSEVSLAPVPFTDHLRVKLDAELDVSATSLQIFNALGQLVHQQSMSRHNEQLESTNWRNGIYHVRIINEGQLVYQANVVKQ